MTNKLNQFGVFKAQKHGNQLVLTIPSNLSVHEGELFELMASADASKLIYVRKKSDNPWFNGMFDHVDFSSLLKETGDLDNIKPVAEEKTDW